MSRATIYRRGVTRDDLIAAVTAQAAMNNLFALKFGFLWRYSNQPVFGFGKTDTTTTTTAPTK